MSLNNSGLTEEQLNTLEWAKNFLNQYEKKLRQKARLITKKLTKEELNKWLKED